MKIKTINFKKFHNLDYEKEREVKGLIIAIALFASSMIIGAGLFRSTPSNISEFSEIFDNYILTRSDASILNLFFNSLIINLIFILISFFAGMSCFGFPVTVILPAIKGLGYGVVTGYLFSEYALSGIGYYLLTILPGGIISNATLLYICNEACFLSADILMIVLAKKQSDNNKIILYTKKLLLLITISVFSSFLDSLLIKAFSYLFIF